MVRGMEGHARPPRAGFRRAAKVYPLSACTMCVVFMEGVPVDRAQARMDDQTDTSMPTRLQDTERGIHGRVVQWPRIEEGAWNGRERSDVKRRGRRV